MNTYPINVRVTDRGVTVENPRRVQAMSIFSGRAKRIAETLAPGEYVFASEADIPESVLSDIREALS